MKTWRRSATRGMTLLELVVVLAILAVVTGMAVASFTAVEDQTRLNVTQQQLTEVEIAVLGEQGLRSPNGQQKLVNGFVADLGRLPQLVDHDTNTSTELQPAELWIMPAGLASFTLRNASFNTDANLNNITSVETTTTGTFTSGTPSATFQDLDIFLPSGWRGPYLRMNDGLGLIRDGWGNPLLPLQTDGATASMPGQEIAILRTLGSNNTLGGTTLSEADRDAIFRTTVLNRSVAGLAVTLKTGVTANEVRVYSPDPATGKIRVYQYSGTPTTYSFGNLPIGPKVIRAYNAGTPATKPNSVCLPSGGLPSLELE